MTNLTIVLGQEDSIKILTADSLEVHKYLVHLISVTAEMKKMLQEAQITEHCLKTNELETDLIWALINLMEVAQSQDLTKLIAFDFSLLNLVTMVGKERDHIDWSLVE